MFWVSSLKLSFQNILIYLGKMDPEGFREENMIRSVRKKTESPIWFCIKSGSFPKTPICFPQPHTLACYFYFPHQDTEATWDSAKKHTARYHVDQDSATYQPCLPRASPSIFFISSHYPYVLCVIPYPTSHMYPLISFLLWPNTAVQTKGTSLCEDRKRKAQRT